MTLRLVIRRVSEPLGQSNGKTSAHRGDSCGQAQFPDFL
jgi:hypothetical protein